MARVMGIGCIIRLREMLYGWRKRTAASTDAASCALGPRADVPEGHVTVRVASSLRRFAVPATLLNHPVFRELLARAAEEYGFGHASPLMIPCDEDLLEGILRHISSSTLPSSCFANLQDVKMASSSLCFMHVGLHGAESRPLFQGPGEKPVW